MFWSTCKRKQNHPQVLTLQQWRHAAMPTGNLACDCKLISIYIHHATSRAAKRRKLLPFAWLNLHTACFPKHVCFSMREACKVRCHACSWISCTAVSLQELVGLAFNYCSWCLMWTNNSCCCSVYFCSPKRAPVIPVMVPISSPSLKLPYCDSITSSLGIIKERLLQMWLLSLWISAWLHNWPTLPLQIINIRCEMHVIHK